MNTPSIFRRSCFQMNHERIFLINGDSNNENVRIYVSDRPEELLPIGMDGLGRIVSAIVSKHRIVERLCFRLIVSWVNATERNLSGIWFQNLDL